MQATQRRSAPAGSSAARQTGQPNERPIDCHAAGAGTGAGLVSTISGNTTNRQPQISLRAVCACRRSEKVLVLLQPVHEQVEALDRAGAGLPSEIALGLVDVADEHQLVAWSPGIEGELHP